MIQDGGGEGEPSCQVVVKSPDEHHSVLGTTTFSRATRLMESRVCDPETLFYPYVVYNHIMTSLPTVHATT